MLNYQIVGDGPPVVLIHGFGISFNIWRNLIPLLKDDFTLIMIGLPGIDGPPEPEGDYLNVSAEGIEELRKELKIDRWRVFSYDLGTRVCQRYIEVHPERVVNAVFLCPLQIQAYKAFALGLVISIDARFPSVGSWLITGSRLDFFIRLLGFNWKPNEFASGWASEISSRPLGILKKMIQCIADHGAGAFQTPPVPHLFIWGIRDLVTASPRKASARHRLIDAMHSAPVTSPGLVAELAFPFLSTT